MYRILIILLCCGLTASAEAQVENISIPVADGLVLAADYHPGPPDGPAVLLLHQCNRDRRMWQPLREELLTRGFSVMTVDFRGYGDSRTDEFDVEDSWDRNPPYFRSDIGFAYTRFQELTAGATHSVVIGASCGGGIATHLAANHTEIDALALFSPSLRELWLPTEDWARLADRSDLPILGVASEEDTNSWNAVQRVFTTSGASDSQLALYKGRIHGEPLFEHDPALAAYIADWVVRALKGSKN